MLWPPAAYNRRQAMDDPFLMLGIESSCDETAAALVCADGSILTLTASPPRADRA